MPGTQVVWCMKTEGCRKVTQTCWVLAPAYHPAGIPLHGSFFTFYTTVFSILYVHAANTIRYLVTWHSVLTTITRLTVCSLNASDQHSTWIILFHLLAISIFQVKKPRSGKPASIGTQPSLLFSYLPSPYDSDLSVLTWDIPLRKAFVCEVSNPGR